MADLNLGYILDRLRSKSPPDFDAYRLYTDEQKAMGDKSIPYNVWHAQNGNPTPQPPPAPTAGN